MKTRDIPARRVWASWGSHPSFPLLMPILCILCMLLIGPTGSSNAQYGPADQVGRALENAGRTIRRNVQNAIEAGQGGVPVVAYEQPLVARVHARLQWEKLLAGSTLDLEVRDDGTAFLRGEVISKEAKERAVLLVRDTIGITQVIDELVVPVPDRKAAMNPTPDSLDPLPAIPGTPMPVPSPPSVTGSGAMIHVRPSRVVRRIPIGSTRVIVRPPVIVPAPAPAAEVIVQP